MSTCLVTGGISNTCKSNAGGIVKCFITDYPTGVTSSSDFLTTDSDGVVTAFTGLTTSIGSFYEFKPSQNSSSFDQPFQISIENGAVGIEQTIALTFPVMTQERRNILDNIIQGNTLVIVLDKNGRYWLAGKENSCEIAEGVASTGKALTDLNGYQITLKALEGSIAPEVQSGSFTVHS